MLRWKEFWKVMMIPLAMLACDFSPPVYKEIIQAQEYLAQQRYRDAVKLYEQVLKTNPAHDIRAKLYYQIGDITSIYLGEHLDAIKYYEEIKKLDNGPEWMVRTEERIADIYFTYLKDFKKSIERYSYLLEVRPILNNRNLYIYRLAEAYLNSGDYDKALTRFESLFAIHEYQAEALYNIGLIHYYKKEWDDALRVWNECLKVEKREDIASEIKFLMANVYEITERLKEAYNLYQSILGKHPNAEVVQERLSSIYNRRIARKR